MKIITLNFIWIQSPKTKAGETWHKTMTNSYCKHICSYCGKVTSASGFPKVSHYRKHVREGIALEIGPTHHEYRGLLEFLNLQRSAKVGTIPANILLHKWSHRPEIGRKIKFRYSNAGEWLTGIVDDINESCIFIELM